MFIDNLSELLKLLAHRLDSQLVDLNVRRRLYAVRDGVGQILRP